MGKRNSCTVLIIVICLIFFDKTAFAETYHYDKLNRVSEIIYDDGSSICYTYDSNGNITDIEKKAASGGQEGSTGENPENTEKEDVQAHSEEPRKEASEKTPEDTGQKEQKTVKEGGASTDTALTGRQIAASNAAYEITGTGKENTVKVRHQKL